MQLLHQLSLHLWALGLALLTILFLSLQKLFPLTMLTAPPFSRLTQVDLRRAEIALTSAQLLALNTTPVVIVPAPGPGFKIVPLICIVHFFGGNAAYLNGGGGFPELLVGSSAYVFTDAGIFLVTVAPNRSSQTMQFAEILDTAGNPPTDENAPLTISKATGNLTQGTGTARVAVYYTIEPCTP